MTRWMLLLALAGPTLADSVAAAPFDNGDSVAAAPFDNGPAVPDPELASIRGGILLPNGLEVAIGISIETRVDGVLALRTSVSTEAPGVRVVTGGSGIPRDGTSVSVDTWAPPEVIVERDRTGTTITSAPGMPVIVTLNSTAPPPTDGTPLPLAPNGGSATTAFGEARLISTANGFVTTLVGPTIEIRQLVGQATGIVVANSADNRVIDTVAHVSVDLSNAGTFINNFGSQIEAAMLSAASRN